MTRPKVISTTRVPAPGRARWGRRPAGPALDGLLAMNVWAHRRRRVVGPFDGEWRMVTVRMPILLATPGRKPGA